MYRSDLTGRPSRPNQRAIRAYETRPHQHASTTQRLWDEEEEEWYLKEYHGGVGPQITREFKILPDEIPEAISRGLFVPEDELRQAERYLEAQRADTLAARIHVVAQWGTHENPQRHVGGTVQGYRVTVNGRPAPAIYPEIPERFRNADKYHLEVK